MYHIPEYVNAWKTTFIENKQVFALVMN